MFVVHNYLRDFPSSETNHHQKKFFLSPKVSGECKGSLSCLLAKRIGSRKFVEQVKCSSFGKFKPKYWSHKMKSFLLTRQSKLRRWRSVDEKKVNLPQEWSQESSCTCVCVVLGKLLPRRSKENLWSRSSKENLLPKKVCTPGKFTMQVIGSLSSKSFFQQEKLVPLPIGKAWCHIKSRWTRIFFCCSAIRPEIW